MELKKCRKCGCMKDALDQAARVFEASEAPEIQALRPRIADYQARMEPLAYDCIGCKKCWGADATIQLASQFEDVEFECGCGDERDSGGIKPALASSKKYANSSAATPWPPHPGDYVLGNLEGIVAVCTLLIAIFPSASLRLRSLPWRSWAVATPRTSAWEKWF